MESDCYLLSCQPDHAGKQSREQLIEVIEMIRRHLFAKRMQYTNVVGTRKKSFSSLDYCINLVQKLDNENYICTLLLPQNIRSAAFAIRAFNVEAATVQDQVSQSKLGMMRFKFWEDCIEKLYKGKSINNPVAVELGKAIQRHRLPKSELLKILSCRARRLDQTSFTNLGDMERHAEESCSGVLLLLLHAANVKSETCQHAALHVGIAQGLANLLRGIPHSIKHRSVPLPSDLLAKHDISEENILRGNVPFEALQEVVFEVSYRALNHLATAREMMDDIPPNSRVIFLPAVSTSRYLENLKNSDFEVFDGGVQKKSPFLPFILGWNSFIRRF